jgi:CRP-like cAMP-binding protein
VVTAAVLDMLSDKDRDRLLAVSGRRTFARNEIVFHEGEPGETLHIVRSGRLAVRVTSTGGDVATLAVLSPGGSSVSWHCCRSTTPGPRPWWPLSRPRR